MLLGGEERVKFDQLLILFRTGETLVLNKRRMTLIQKKPKSVVSSSTSFGNMTLVRKKLIFLSRFAPSVAVYDVENIVKPLNLGFSRCVRLKNKFEMYISFFLEFSATDFQKVRDPNIWPEGILIAPFYGELKEESIYNISCNREPAEDCDLKGNS